MTFQDILQATYSEFRYSTSPKASTVTRITGNLDMAHRELVREHPKLRQDELTFVTERGERTYSLPTTLVDVIAMSTAQQPLAQKTTQWLRRFAPNAANQSGTPYAWVPFTEQRAVIHQPTVNTQLWVKSTSANDSSDNVSVTVEYLRVNGYPGVATANANGTSAIRLGTDSDIRDITRFYTSVPVVGLLTLQANSSTGNLYSVISPGLHLAKFRAVQLYPTPSGAIDIYVDYTRALTTVTANPMAEPSIREDYHDLLYYSLCLKEALYLDDPERREKFQQLVNDGMKKLNSAVMNITEPIIPNSLGQSVGFSPFGANYPPER